MENETLRAKIDIPVTKESKTTDVFNIDAKVAMSYDGVNQNFKRRMSRKISKVWTGVDGAESKQLIPQQDITSAYGLLLFLHII